MDKNTYYITTAIPYANDNPHVGHALLFLYADVIARYQRLVGKDVYFLIGTDEHGQKMLKAAKEKGREVEEYCSEKSAVFSNLADQWNISNNDFIRTTEDRHKKSAQKIWELADKKGDIYKKKYSGLYCVGCEAYKTEKDLVDGKCPDHLKEPEILEEENYFFRLSKYQKELEAHFKNNLGFVFPQNRYNEMLNILKNGLEDISISRSVEKLTWGIPVPGDDTQVMYVWFDALTNYITALGFKSENSDLFNKYWPAQVHVIGKEINRFHSLLWPAMLMSVGIELPKMIAAHGFITVNGQKMSKTIGNVIDPLKMSSEYPVDSVRYFFIREFPFDNDGDYSDEKFIARYNADLANGIGNLTNRILSMIDKYCDGIVPDDKETETSFKKEVAIAFIEYKKAMDIFRFDQALESVFKLITYSDQIISEKEPWNLAKNNKLDELNSLLNNLVETLRQISVMLYPVMPEVFEKLSFALNLKVDDEFKEPLEELLKWRSMNGVKIIKNKPLFPRIE